MPGIKWSFVNENLTIVQWPSLRFYIASTGVGFFFFLRFIFKITLNYVYLCVSEFVHMNAFQSKHEIPLKLEL